MAKDGLQPGCPPGRGLETPEGSIDTEREERSALLPLVGAMTGDRVTAVERIVIIDERAFRRECVVRMLREVLPGHSVTAFGHPRDLSRNAWAPGGGQEVSVVILNIGWTRLPDERVGMDVRYFQERFQGVRIILLSDREDSAQVAEALSYGVRGFIPTSIDARVVAEVIQLVGAGGTFVPASALVHARASQGIFGRSQGAKLTPRECEVLNLLREGKQNKIIAATLGMKEATVKIHVRHILKKMKATNRTEAAVMAARTS